MIVRGPDFLRNVIVSGKVAFHQINKFLVNDYYFFIIDKMALRAAFGDPALVTKYALKLLYRCNDPR